MVQDYLKEGRAGLPFGYDLRVKDPPRGREFVRASRE